MICLRQLDYSSQTRPSWTDRKAYSSKVNNSFHYWYRSLAEQSAGWQRTIFYTHQITSDYVYLMLLLIIYFWTWSWCWCWCWCWFWLELWSRMSAANIISRWFLQSWTRERGSSCQAIHPPSSIRQDIYCTSNSDNPGCPFGIGAYLLPHIM